MAGKLKPITWRTLVRKLHNLGFNGPYIGGEHHFMTKAELRLTVPNSHTGDISAPLLSEILARGGISRQDWLKTK